MHVWRATLRRMNLFSPTAACSVTLLVDTAILVSILVLISISILYPFCFLDFKKNLYLLQTMENVFLVFYCDINQQFFATTCKKSNQTTLHFWLHFLCCVQLPCTSCQFAEGARRHRWVQAQFRRFFPKIIHAKCDYNLPSGRDCRVFFFFLCSFPSSPSQQSWHAANNRSIFTLCVNRGDQSRRRCALVPLDVPIHSPWM